ncbi:MAG: hypothetical protein IRZ21_00190 [Thermoleophilaceae bacterium]|nr:hypothetical protein [Thermoleophilaceae bacterium]
MASERERLAAEMWRIDVQPWVEQSILELGSFHRIVGAGEAMLGPWGVLADALMRRTRPLARPGRLPLAFILAVTADAVHALEYAPRAREGVKIRREAARWPRGGLRAEVREGERDTIVALEWDGGSARCRAGINARSVAQLLPPLREG